MKDTQRPQPSGTQPSEKLRSSTKRIHEEVESSLDWSRMLGTRDEYLQLLGRLWRLNAPADALIAETFPEVPELEGRRTAAWIERDIAAVDPEQGLPAAETVADYSFATSESAIAGVTYVLEGSSLGGMFLAREVEQKLGLTLSSGASYLNGYGRNAGQRWNGVKVWLDRCLTTEANVAEATEAAVQTFELYQQTLRTES